MRVERRCVINADRDAVWKIVSDPDCYPSFMTKIGSVPVGGLIEVVEFDECRDLAWVGITGVTLRGRIRLRNTAQGQTKVMFRLSYQAPGGILGYIADRVAVRQVGRNLTETLKCLKKLVES
jgi:uncharacterized membrane protein